MFEECLSSLQKNRLELEDVANRLIDGYWGWFNTQCRATHEAVARGEGVKAGRVAPVIEKKQSGQHVKIYIKWKDFGGQKFRRTNPKASFDIAPGKTESYRNQIAKHASWEAVKALELEEQLIPIRIQLQGIHEAIVRLTSAQRKINRQLTNVSQQ